MDNPRSLVIIGSGPAAWTAAIYAARAALSPLVLAGEQSGGQLMLTREVENFPGYEQSILGPELIRAMRNQAQRLGVEIIDREAALISISNSLFSVLFRSSAGDETIIARTIIVATGAVANTLKIPGENRLMGRGVGTCAVCDAPFYQGRDTVFVVGGGDSAMEESLALSKYASKIIILVRKDKLRASHILTERVQDAQNIKIWYQTEVKELLGKQKLERVRLVRQGKERTLAADGLFYAIGHTPATKWLQGSGIKLDEKGYIKTDWDFGYGKLERGTSVSPVSQGIDFSLSKSHFPTMTSVAGIFAAGDCVDPRYRQAITAAGFGCMAALDAQKWLES